MLALPTVKTDIFAPCLPQLHIYADIRRLGTRRQARLLPACRVGKGGRGMQVHGIAFDPPCPRCLVVIRVSSAWARRHLRLATNAHLGRLCPPYAEGSRSK